MTVEKRFVISSGRVSRSRGVCARDRLIGSSFSFDRPISSIQLGHIGKYTVSLLLPDQKTFLRLPESIFSVYIDSWTDEARSSLFIVFSYTYRYNTSARACVYYNRSFKNLTFNWDIFRFNEIIHRTLLFEKKHVHIFRKLNEL